MRVQAGRDLRAKVVFFFDVDNTLLDNDRIIADLNAFLQREVGPKRARRYWTLFEDLRGQLGYADYLGALQRFRHDFPSRVTTVFVRQGHYAQDREILAKYPHADVSVRRIGDLLKHDGATFTRPHPSN
jgi:FMN phosphatase YigB (HAD superfamily)